MLVHQRVQYVFINFGPQNKWSLDYHDHSYVAEEIHEFGSTLGWKCEPKKIRQSSRFWRLSTHCCGNVFDPCLTSSHFAGWKDQDMFELYNLCLYSSSTHVYPDIMIYLSNVQIKHEKIENSKIFEPGPASISPDGRKGRICSLNPAHLLQMRSEAAA